MGAVAVLAGAHAGHEADDIVAVSGVAHARPARMPVTRDARGQVSVSCGEAIQAGQAGQAGQASGWSVKEMRRQANDIVLALRRLRGGIVHVR